MHPSLVLVGDSGRRGHAGDEAAKGSFMPTLPPDAALLAEVPEDILCFSRSFEDLTCFWDEEEASAIHRFYYTCAVSTQRSGVSGMRHICVFPSQDVRLFTPLHVLVRSL